ncbi:MAG: helix-turn-helix domain-containing protein [Treponema sp.]|nr:helix-turn-helix domain-containing protein [Treponema sp.]
MEPETAQILDNLRKIRIQQKISVLTLANTAGISHSHLFYIEKKSVVPSIDVVVKLAKALRIPLKNLADASSP